MEVKDKVVETEVVEPEINTEIEAGEEQEVVDTAATGEPGILEEEESDGLSFEDIFEPKTDIEKSKENTPPWLQKRLDKVVGEKKVIAEELRQLKAEKLVSEKPAFPLQEEFETTEEYRAAVDTYIEKKPQYEEATKAVADLDAKSNTVIQENNNRYITQAEQLQKEFPSMNVRETIDNTVFGSEGSAAIARSEHSAKIALYYARNKNPEVLKAFQQMDFATACGEIGKLEARISKPLTDKAATKAAKPLDTLKGDAETVRPPKNLYEIKDSNEWFKARNKAEYEKRKAAGLL